MHPTFDRVRAERAADNVRPLEPDHIAVETRHKILRSCCTAVLLRVHVSALYRHRAQFQRPAPRVCFEQLAKAWHLEQDWQVSRGKLRDLTSNSLMTLRVVREKLQHAKNARSIATFLALDTNRCDLHVESRECMLFEIGKEILLCCCEDFDMCCWCKVSDSLLDLRVCEIVEVIV